MMKSPADIERELASIRDPEAEWERQVVLAEEIESHLQGASLVPAVLRLFETFPEADFGAPGRLAHAIERFYGPSYVQALHDSLRRRPTAHTLFLAQRVINARDANSTAMRQAVEG